MQWKHVMLPGFEKYEISASGQIRNSETGRILHPTWSGKTNVCVNLHDKWNHNKLFTLRNLVYETWVGPCKGMMVEYINGNPWDNAPKNLRLKAVVTPQARSARATGDFHTIKGIWDRIMQEQMPESYATIWGAKRP